MNLPRSNDSSGASPSSSVSSSGAGFLSYFRKQSIPGPLPSPPSYEDSEEIRIRGQGAELVNMAVVSGDRAILIYGIGYLIRSLGEISNDELPALGLSTTPVESATSSQRQQQQLVESTVEEIVGATVSAFRFVVPLLVLMLDAAMQKGKMLARSEAGTAIVALLTACLRGATKGARKHMA
jgi:hypothetical protein